MKRIKTNDNVVIISGKEKGKRGTVLEISSKKDAVQVEKIALVSKHQKQKNSMGAAVRSNGIKKIESWIPLSKVMPFCSHCDKASRIVIKVLESGLSDRACCRCKQAF